MCGIVGFISNKKQEEVLNDMLKILSHRGPDDKGIFIDNLDNRYIHLGHNRLAIMDLSENGHQPMVSNCGNYIIVFNGEIYNFKDIKKELQKDNILFKSNTDTEVILYAFKKWGINCINKFIGMFAIAIYDKTNSKLFLIRDRAGVKPLYYYANGNEFLFSSEIKAFHKFPNFKKEINIDVLPYFFQFGYIPSPFSIFKNCYKLEPGHFLELNLKTLEYHIYQYWNVDEFYKKEKFDISEREILSELEKLLVDAINLRMVSDVPVGIFLSGGYDSSLVTAILSNHYSRLNTFTIGFENKNYDEAEHAKMIARYFGTNHTEYYVTEQEMKNKITDLVFFYDEPFGDSSAIPTMIVSEIAKQNVKVALSADGGDEAFCGYSKYIFLNKINNIFSNKLKKVFLKLFINMMNDSTVDFINSVLPEKYKQRNIRDKFIKFKRAVNANNLEEMFINASSYVDKLEVSKFLNIKLKNTLYKKFKMKENLGIIDNMMRIDYKTFMVDDILTKVDRATMSVSLEGREPLIDHRLVEFMARVPENLKCKDNKGKYLERQIIYKYIPSNLIDKPKSGFQIPLYEWLRGDLKYLIEDYINKDMLDEEIFNIQEVDKIKKLFLKGDITYLNAIWFILVFQMWKEKWFK